MVASRFGPMGTPIVAQQSFNFNDRNVLESIFGKERKLKFKNRFFNLSQITFKDFIKIYITHKRLAVLKRYEFLPRQLLTRKNSKGRKFVHNPKTFTKLGLSRIKGRTSLRRVIWFSLLCREEDRKAIKLIKQIFKIKVKRKEINDFLKLVNGFNANQFSKRRDSDNGSIFSRNFESWAHSLIDVLASNYGWEIDYILNQKYVCLLELLATANNRNVSSKIAQVSAAISGHVGSGEIYSDLKDEFVKRRVFIPMNVLRRHDQIERQKLSENN